MAFMDADRRRLVFKPNEQEQQLPFAARMAFARRGAHRLTPITYENDPEFSALLDAVSERVGVEKPYAFIWDTKFADANALAMNTRPPVIAFSRAATQLLNTEEMAAITAHELGHVKNQKHSGKMRLVGGLSGIATASLALTPARQHLQSAYNNGLSASIFYLGQAAMFGVQVIGARIGAAFTTRREEYAADRFVTSALQGNPVALLSALDKLGDYTALHADPTQQPQQNVVQKWLRKATRSHPTFDERCEALGVTQAEVAAYQAAQLEGNRQNPQAGLEENAHGGQNGLWQNKEKDRQAGLNTEPSR